MKSRGVYETPGGTVLLAARRAMESICLDRGEMHLKDELMPRCLPPPVHHYIIVTLRYFTLCYATLPGVTLHYIMLHNIALCDDTLLYLTFGFTSWGPTEGQQLRLYWSYRFC